MVINAYLGTNLRRLPKKFYTRSWEFSRPHHTNKAFCSDNLNQYLPISQVTKYDSDSLIEISVSCTNISLYLNKVLIQFNYVLPVC